MPGRAAEAPQPLPAQALAQIRFDQRLNAQVPLDLSFRDSTGKRVALKQYFNGKPVVLVLGYYQCPMLCTLVLNGLIAALEDVKWTAGTEFDVVDVSIDPLETPVLAAAKKSTYLRSYGRAGASAGWHFLTGDARAIKALADVVGFHYAYDPASKQYAHPSGILVLTPQGKVSQYVLGVTYSPKLLSAALKTAAGNQTGSPVQQLFLLCFHFNPVTGKYSVTILGILRLMAIATIAGLSWLFFAMVKRGRAAQATRTPPVADSTLHAPAGKHEAP